MIYRSFRELPRAQLSLTPAATEIRSADPLLPFPSPFPLPPFRLYNALPALLDTRLLSAATIDAAECNLANCYRYRAE